MPTPARVSGVNRTIWRTTVVLAVTLAVAGFHHGLFEALQGNHATPGLGIHSIGPDHQRWAYGTDDAITLVPNFLATGVAAMTVSLGIVAWSVLGLESKRGASVLLALFVLLTLVGGGMGHIPFFLALWAYATRIRGDLSWWRRRLRSRLRTVLSRGWLPALLMSALLFLAALELSVFGYPPLAADPDLLLLVIWSVLGASLVLLNLAFVGAIARDLEPRR